MQKIKLFGISLLLGLIPILNLAQSSSNEGINYQAVLSQNGTVLANQEVKVRFSVFGQSSQFIFYQEEQTLSTDDQGRIAAVIGQGEPQENALESELKAIPWTDPDIELIVEMNLDGSGFTEISREPFRVVPFSYVAQTVRELPEIRLDGLADIEASTPEEGQVLQWSGSNWAPGTVAGSPWTQSGEDKISYTGKIGLNVANPIFDLQSEGNFFHEGFFQVANNTFPAMRLRHNASGGVSPKATFQFTISGEQGQGTIEYSPNLMSMRTIGEDNSSGQIYLRNNGRLGINISNPAEKLDVNGGIKIANTNSTNAGTIRWTGSDFEGRKGSEWVSLTQQGGSGSSPWASGSNNSINYGKGNVGIGETAPEEKLHIHNDDPILGSPSKILITNSITSSVRSEGLSIGLSNTADGTAARILNKDDGSLFLGSNDQSVMVFTNKGLVGIGDLSPNRLLTVGTNNTSTASQLLVNQDGSGDAVMNIGLGSGSNYALGVDNSDSDKFKIGYRSDGPGTLNNSPLLTLQTNGNLGVGTTTPARRLTVSLNNNNQLTSNFLVEQRGSGDAFMNFSLEGGRSYALGIDNSDGDKFKIGTNSTTPRGVDNSTLMELDASGNIEVSGNMEVSGKIRRTATGNANLVPIAMGKIDPKGEIVEAVSTNNFTVKDLGGDQFEITVDEDVSDVSFTSEAALVIASVTGPKANFVTASQGVSNNKILITLRVFALPANVIDVSPVPSNNYRVSFVVYRP